MTDKEGGEHEDQISEELKQLSESIRSGVGPRNYVAQPAPGYDVHGVWHCFGTDSRSGYATHAIATHWMMSERLGIPTQLVPHRNRDIDIERFPKDRYDMLFEWHKEAVGHPHMLLCSYPPEVAAELDGLGPPLVPYCAFEGTKVGKYMASLCNGDAFKAIWVVSPFVRDALALGGVDSSRVVVVRPPVCDGPWTMLPDAILELAKQHPVSEERPYTFGALGTWHKRKGFHDLVRAYFSTFFRDQPVKLVIRTSAFGSNITIRELKAKITAEIAEIAASLGDDGFPESKQQPRLQLLLGTDATDQEVIDWLGSLDCYVNATYGEGLGIPHIWAKANGVPMVSTGYGAVGQMLSELSKEGSKDAFVGTRVERVDPEMCRLALMYDPDTMWGTYDPEELGRSMVFQYNEGRRYDHASVVAVRKMFSADACEAGLREALRGVLEKEWIEKWGI